VGDYLKWLRFYLDFCMKYRHPPRDRESLEPFLGKLTRKRQSLERQKQTAASVGLYYGLVEPEKSSCPQMTQIDADKVPNPRSSASSAGTFCLSRSFTKWVRRVTSPSSMFADICVGIGGSTAEYRFRHADPGCLSVSRPDSRLTPFGCRSRWSS